MIAGSAKGRRLKTVAGNDVRPSGDRLKEGLFSSLGPLVVGARVLDLFAGSGALGIEALSRGAAFATFVEKDGRAAAMIEANLDATGFFERAQLAVESVDSFLEKGKQDPFELVLIDPPYAAGLPSQVVNTLNEKGLLADGGLVVVEVSSRILPVDAPAGFQMQKQRRFGDSTLLFLKPENEK